MKFTVKTLDVTQNIPAPPGAVLREIINAIGGRPQIFGEIVDAFPNEAAKFYYFKGKKSYSYGEAIYADKFYEIEAVAYRIYQEGIAPETVPWLIRFDAPMGLTPDIVINLESQDEAIAQEVS